MVRAYYAFSAEIIGALLIIPGIYARWAALYAVPLIIGAAQFWLARRGFYSTAAGDELPMLWGCILIIFAFWATALMPWSVRLGVSGSLAELRASTNRTEARRARVPVRNDDWRRIARQAVAARPLVREDCTVAV